MADIIWTSPDGIWGVVKAKDVPPGVPRSRTRDDPKDAENATWEPQLVVPVGPGSINKYVKVRIADIQPGAPRPQVVLRPSDYANGNGKGKKFIPEYPHTCAVCGGKMLMLFSSQEHEGGKPCPGPKQQELFKRRR